MVCNFLVNMVRIFKSSISQKNMDELTWHANIDPRNLKDGG